MNSLKALELVGTSKRVAAGMGIQTFFTVGYAVVGLLAYLIRDWHVLQLTLSLPGVFFLSYYWSAYIYIKNILVYINFDLDFK